MFPQVFPLNLSESALTLKVLNFLIYNTDTIKDATCPITVAIAAPLTPILKTKMNMGSRDCEFHNKLAYRLGGKNTLFSDKFSSIFFKSPF